ncbi:DNA polymerase III subunit delta' [Rubeoparvulum massiliense]|uniref:DNA polymerase III subunit delta' n=1 Tax=Rubeoparvulum massiliense TaxID=1631346 RepID=UPI00065E94ED|nr:DNA polymerase III subunit delta' [Rubeoparvulum massiliense]
MSLRTIPFQEEIGQQLQEVIKGGRIAHAYCFSGEPGSGAMAMAIEMAKALFCMQGDGDACGECANCRRIDHQNFPAVQVIDASESPSIKIEQVRQLQDQFSYRSIETERKVYIIYPAEKLTIAASNALLKFLEEPESQVVAILVTGAPHQLLPTILSRCQILSFSSPPYLTRVTRLTEEGFSPEIAHLAANFEADYLKARELCEADWFAEVRSLVLELIQDIFNKRSDSLWLLQDRILGHPQVKERPAVILQFMMTWLRDLLQVQCGRESSVSYVQQQGILAEYAKRLNRQQILHSMDIVLMTRRKLESHVNQQLALEWMILRLQEG